MAKQRKNPTLPFYDRLVLNQFILKNQFGYRDFYDISKELKEPESEGIDNENHTKFYYGLLSRLRDDLPIKKDIEKWDLNIVSHLLKINKNRDDKISLKYFQWLSLLFTEFYLDNFFNHKQKLLEALNDFVTDFNSENPDCKISEYKDTDLNKIAFWNATGSGKTIIMHINYHQYLHYAGNKMEDGSSFILLTPKEGLSNQHIDDFSQDGIPAKTYDKYASRLFADKTEIQALEVTKLGESDGDKTVAAERFGTGNVLFVDEGHRGASGDTWYSYRNRLCETGFSFEYSATFGQAVSGNETLSDEYAKCILFDYSYKYFYGDGFGKDYSIINLQKEANEHQTLYLTACLLAFYQQKKLYDENKSEYKKFNIENPLFIFVGSSVNAVRTENHREVSDVIDILLFLESFISNQNESVSNLQTIISGNTGFLNSRNEDIFAKKYPALMGGNANEIYKDILKKVFNCDVVGAQLYLGDVRGVQGEITLWVGDNQTNPFGLINVGDDGKLLKLCEANGLNKVTDNFGISRFDTITKSDSTINILIGSKKFSEGWNCWRVSTMGLMNVGQSEGSEIIQLFGRGVRLKGYDMSLKRSSAYKKNNRQIIIPKNINIVETLNVFGVHANYMESFRAFLESERIPAQNETITLTMPAITNNKIKQKKLYILKLPKELNFKTDAPNPIFEFNKKYKKIELDCYSKVQFQSSLDITETVSKNRSNVPKEAISLLDFDRLYFEIENYKDETSRRNMNVSKQAIESLFKNDNRDWYTLYIPDNRFDFEDLEKWHNIALSLLKKYFDAIYYTEKGNWETPLMNLELLNEDDKNFFIKNYDITIENPDEKQVEIDYCNKLIEAAKSVEKLANFTQMENFKAAHIAEHLYNPVLFYNPKGTLKISISPVALVDSEWKFVNHLKNYLDPKNRKESLADKEVFLIRNISRKGIGFFLNTGFYPDFILWILEGSKQRLIFIDPHGMHNEPLDSPKVHLFEVLKNKIAPNLTDKNVTLDSFILSPTNWSDMNPPNKEAWERNHVLFMADKEYLEQILN